MLVALDRAAGVPLRRQLETHLRAGVRDGRLRAGTRLPSSRDLARQLGVSRGVVVDAYAALGAQGFLVLRPRAAPVVAAVAPAAPADEDASEDEDRPPRHDFTATAPDVALFDRAAWARALARVLREAPDAALDYGDPLGTPAARAALAGHLGRVRGVVADPAAVAIVQGYTQAVDVAFRALADRGARVVAFESPSHDEQWRVARRAGLRPVTVPVDADGLRVDALAATDADAVVVTPAHQFPTGVVLAPERRRALLAWAAERGATIVEDDYDAEFRYDRAPVGTLQGLDPERVLYVGTASKTLAPALRTGWAVVPATLRPAFAAGKNDADGGSPALEQLALAELLRGGAYERGVLRARARYRARRDALVAALRAELPACGIAGVAAGLHLVLRLPAGADEAAAAAACAAARIRVRPLGDWALDGVRDPAPALVLGYGWLAEPAIPAAVRALAAALATVA
nr:PLP-dependent aminotransferase family protein [Patulibacter sp. SYSU D01012]